MNSSLHTNPTDTEVSAYESVLPHLNNMRIAILEALEEMDNATGSEVSDVTGIWLYTAKPRLTELKQMGLVTDTELRRKNKRGQNEIVWSITTSGKEVLRHV